MKKETIVNFFREVLSLVSIPEAARSKAWDCCRSLVGNAGSSPTAVHECLLIGNVVCCQVEISAKS